MLRKLQSLCLEPIAEYADVESIASLSQCLSPTLVHELIMKLSLYRLKELELVTILPFLQEVIETAWKRHILALNITSEDSRSWIYYCSSYSRSYQSEYWKRELQNLLMPKQDGISCQQHKEQIQTVLRLCRDVLTEFSRRGFSTPLYLQQMKLQDELIQFKKLKCLQILHCRTGDIRPEPWFKDVIINSTTLERVCIKYGRISPAMVDEIRLATIERQEDQKKKPLVMEFSAVSFHDRVRALESLLQLVCTGSLRGLIVPAELHLSMSDGQELTRAILAAPEFEIISLESANITSQICIEALDSGVVKRAHVDLSSCQVDSGAWDFLFQLLFLSPLISLNLSYTGFGEHATVRLFSNHLRHCGTRLQYLNLFHSSLGEGQAEILLEALAKHTSIQVLDIGDTGCRVNADAIGRFLSQTKSSIRQFYAGYVHIQNPSSPILMNALRQCEVLHKLDLSHNRLGDYPACLVFKTMIESKRSDCSLDLSGNRISLKGVQEMAEYLEDLTDEPTAKRRRTEIPKLQQVLAELRLNDNMIQVQSHEMYEKTLVALRGRIGKVFSNH